MSDQGIGVLRWFYGKTKTAVTEEGRCRNRIARDTKSSGTDLLTRQRQQPQALRVGQVEA